MQMMSVAKARKIMCKTTPELLDKEMEDLIKFLYTLARIEVDGLNRKIENAETIRKNSLRK